VPVAKNNGVGIHYKVTGDGPALVLMHGFTRLGADWVDCGYVSALKATHQVITIDARGHGMSDKPHEADAYVLEKRVADVVAVLDDLGLDKATYWGYSMGGRTGFAMAKFAPERLHAIVIGGVTPTEPGFDAFKDIDGSDITEFVAMLERFINEKIPPERIPDLARNDTRALTALMQAPLDDFGDAFSALTIPKFLYVGEADKRYDRVKALAASNPDADFASFGGLNHGAGFLRRDLVLPEVANFLKEHSRLGD
jgi:pimeloyl-ACP methyl ester carboxylesterase